MSAAQRHQVWRAAPLLLALAITACERPTTHPPAQAPMAEAPEAGIAPLLAAGERAIPGRYVVVFRDDEVQAAAALTQQLVTAHGGELHHTYEHTIRGFAATLTPAALEGVRRDPNVRYVAEDMIAEMSQTTQLNATWGLDRVDQRDRPLNTRYRYGPTGSGVRVYVIDSGIRTAHTEFAIGRASVGLDLVGDGQNGQDCNGHGTHVAGTIAGTTYGVAKSARVISVRVFGCTGGAPYSRIISAVDWVTANHIKPAVANMSLGGGFFQPANDAVTASINAGVTYAVAAGNDNINACNTSPASTPNAITVGSTTSGDARSGFSNWGTCVNIFAPGSSITSAWWTSNTATNTIGGTSMASPHVAGAAALYLQANPAHTPAQVRTAIYNAATFNRLTSIGTGSPNMLLYTNPPRAAISLSHFLLHYSFLRPAVPGASMGRVPEDSSLIPRFVASSDGGPRTVTSSEDDVMHIASAHSSIASQPFRITNTGTARMYWSSTTSQRFITRNPVEGELAVSGTARVDVTANSTSLDFGEYSGALTLSDPEAQISPATVNVMVSVATPAPLRLAVPIGGLSGALGTFRYYTLEVPEGLADLHVSIAGSSGDADLYVRYGDAPSRSQWDCRPFSGSSNETCAVGLPAGGTYYVMVHAWTTYSGLTLQASAGGVPLAPTDLRGQAASETQINVYWSDNSTNESSFQIQRRTWSGSAWSAWAHITTRSANSTAYANTGLAAGTTYQYRIRSCAAAGCSGWSNSPSITAMLVPAAPSGVTATAAAPDRINLSWTDNSSNETSFRIERREYVDGVWGPYAWIASRSANATTYANLGLTPLGRYQYRIQACNGGGCSGYSYSSGVTTPPLPPAAPSNLAGTPVSSTYILLTWVDNSSNETSFQLHRRLQNPDGTWASWVSVAAVAANSTSYHNSSGLLAGRIYEYRLRACNTGGCSAYVFSSAVSTPAAFSKP